MFNSSTFEWSIALVHHANNSLNYFDHMIQLCKCNQININLKKNGQYKTFKLAVCRSPACKPVEKTVTFYLVNLKNLYHTHTNTHTHTHTHTVTLTHTYTHKHTHTHTHTHTQTHTHTHTHTLHYTTLHYIFP